MDQRELVALALRVEDPVCEPAHQGALLLAPAICADRLHERLDLARHPLAPGAATLHQLAHPGLAHAHLRSGLGAREPLQVAQHGGLALAAAEAPAQPLEQLAEPDAIIELPREVAVDVRGAAPAPFLSSVESRTTTRVLPRLAA